MPFSTWSLHRHLLLAWMPLAGGSEYALRFPSLWAATALVALSFALGRWVSGDRVGLGAALLATLSPPMLYYAQNARSYAMTFLFVGLAFYALLRLQAASPARRWWVIAPAGLALGAYSHLWVLSGLPGAGLAMAWAARRGGWPTRAAAAAALGALGLALLPWLGRPSASRSFENTLVDYAARASQVPDPLLFLREVGAGMLAIGLPQRGRPMLPLTAVGAGLALLVGGAVVARRRPGALGLVGLLVLLPLALSYAVVQVAPYFGARYVLFLGPLLWVLAAGGLAVRGRLAPLAALPLALVVAGWAPLTYPQAPTDRREHLGGLAAEVRAAFQPGDALVVTSGWREPNLAYYLQGVDLHWVGVPVEGGYTTEQLRAEADRLAGQYRRVWVAFFGVTET